MPAASSSPIAPALGQLLAAAPSLEREPARLLPVLAAIPDPRARRGVRHRLAVILGLALCAVLAGARSFTAIAEWTADADQATRDALGVTGVVPSESTFRRTLQALDADALDQAAGGWAQQRTAPAPGQRRAVAVDGKTLRGSGTADGPGRHLLSALDHEHGVVLGQVDVQAKTNEIPLFTTLLDHVDLAGAVVTADALHAQRAHAEYLVTERGAHYLITIKRNQPGLHAQLAGLPWRHVPVACRTQDKGHGRAERRTLKITAVAAGLAFPHAAQAIQIVRRRRPLTGKNTKKWSTETVYAITSLAVIQALPADLARITRGHWGIEDRLHWVRDVTYDEDRSQIRTANGPRVMASLRNLAIAILRLTGHASIAAALRYHARQPSRPLQTIMQCLRLCRGPGPKKAIKGGEDLTYLQFDVNGIEQGHDVWVVK
jgi:predicted transposase YbfD/YdcC